MTTPSMPYRRLGPTGLKVSVLSFGSWVSFGTQLDTGMARDCLDAAREAGVNFFDNAEAYAGGESERIMGRARRVGAARGGGGRGGGLAARVVLGFAEVALGPPRGRQPPKPADPQLPQARDRRLPRARRPPLPRLYLLPIGRAPV